MATPPPPQFPLNPLHTHTHTRAPYVPVAVCPAGAIVNDVEVPRGVVVMGVATDAVLVTQAQLGWGLYKLHPAHP
jgi:hypothetical protein